MKNNILTILFIFFLMGCKTSEETKDLIRIETEHGDMIIKLYDNTPDHKANFIKLVEDKFYDGLLFHRVIKDFMIQTGDPSSKDAKAGVPLGYDGPGYTIPAEILPQNYHKKGAIAAAREGDGANPEKKSSGSQFYIVQGKQFAPDELLQIENYINTKKKQAFIQKYIETQLENSDSYEALLNKAQAEWDQQNPDLLFHFTEEQKQVYTTIGGYPALDGQYTVFGEVVEGLDVIDNIAKEPTDKSDRPLKDTKIKITFAKN